MMVMDLYRRAVTCLYRFAFSGPCTGLTVTGLLRITNPKSIWCGENVYLKQGSCLYPGSRSESIRIGDNSEIHENCFLRTFDSGYIHLGESVSVNYGGIILGGGGVRIGNMVRIGPRLNIATNNHNFSDPDVPILLQGETRKQVSIEDDVWIGMNVTILPGVRIGKGTVVAAGSVVTKDIADYSIAAGVPAEIIGNR